MILRFSRAARDQASDLIDFYLQRNRTAAAVRLLDDLDTAQRVLLAEPEAGLPSPRPYPELARFGQRWRPFRAYWIAWKVTDDGVVVTNVFHVSADIPGRASAALDDVEEWQLR